VPRVFISYRRDDASGHAGRLYDSLASPLGAENVFMDVDAIGLGSDFAEVIADAVKRCDVVVALIGRRWVSAAGPEGRRRLDDPDDFVRIELESALGNDIVVIPTAVQGAGFPVADELPPSLEPLSRRQGIELHDTSWHDDVRRLLRRLERLGAEQQASPPPAATPEPAPLRRRRRLALAIGLAIAAVAAIAAGVVLAVGGGSHAKGTGSTGGLSSLDRRLLAAIPAVTRPTCHPISYGERSALTSLECAAPHLSVDYNLFPSAAVMRGWYVEQRDTAGIPPGSPGCRVDAFRGEGVHTGGREFCFTGSGAAPTIVWTEAPARVRRRGQRLRGNRSCSRGEPASRMALLP
jgi:hypothetical protein